QVLGQPGLDVGGGTRQRLREHLTTLLGDQDIVLDAHTDTAQLLGDGQVVGLEVQTRLHGEHHARFQVTVQVHPLAGDGTVVHVHAEHVTGAVQGVSALQSQLQYTVERPFQQSPHDQFLGQHTLGDIVVV